MIKSRKNNILSIGCGFVMDGELVLTQDWAAEKLEKANTNGRYAYNFIYDTNLANLWKKEQQLQLI